MPSDLGPQTLTLTKGDIRVRTRGNLTALTWKDRRDVYMLRNMDLPPAEGNFCDDSKRAVNPQIVARYNVDISDRMAGQQLFDVSTYLQGDHEIVFPPSGSNSSEQMDSDIFMWG